MLGFYQTRCHVLYPLLDYPYPYYHYPWLLLQHPTQFKLKHLHVSISVTTAWLGLNASSGKLYLSITCSWSHYPHCPLKEQLNILCSGHVINAKWSLTNYSLSVFLGLINLSLKPKAALVLTPRNASQEIQHMIIVLMIYINKTPETNESVGKCALCLFVPTNHCGWL